MADYTWLSKEPAPRMLLEALKLLGVHEGPGAVDNPVILAWAAEVGLKYVYTHDATPWCGLFMAVVASRAGKPLLDPPADMLWALNWGRWGEDGGQPELGDILTFLRPGGGHVGLYVGEDKTAYHVLGGNTSDRVSIARIDKTRMRRCRQFFATAKPPNVRPVLLSPDGELSTNEV